MTHTLLVTTGNGMFGRALVNALAGDVDVNVRALVRNESAFNVSAPNVSSIVGDMDKPETLVAAVDGVDQIFLVSPMDEHIAEREIAVIDAAVATGRPIHVFKLHGAVHHRGDHLDSLHQQSIAHLKASGLPWTMISPNSVMETSLLPYAFTIGYDALFGTSGHGAVAFVALADVAEATAAAVKRTDLAGAEVLMTGPAAVDMFQVAQDFSDQLGREITYYDMPEDAYAKMLLDEGIYPSREALEVGVLCHFRAWARGDAATVTDGCERMTGKPPMTVKDWIGIHIDQYNKAQTPADLAAAAQIKSEFAQP